MQNAVKYLRPLKKPLHSSTIVPEKNDGDSVIHNRKQILKEKS